jgi:bacillopeptidase F
MLFLATTNAAIIDPELETALESIHPAETVPVIIKLKNTIPLRPFQQTTRLQRRAQFIKNLRENAELTQRPLLNFLKGLGTKNPIQLWLINGIAVTLTGEVIHELSLRPGIISIRLDKSLSLPEVSPGSAKEPESSLNAIRAPELWSLGHTGEGTVVAIMDSGVDLNHPDLNDKWRDGTNSWFDPNGEHEMPYDVQGHGTQIMGLMIGGSAGDTSIGVAPGAQWIAVKIFNDAGEAPLSAIHQGFQWILDPDNNPDTDDAPDVVNNSWGSDDNVDECIYEFQEDIQALKAAEIAVVFSAGNGGPFPSTSISPANYPGSFTVGAVDDNSTIQAFSSRGPSACDGSLYPLVVAPGVNVRTSDLTFGGVFPDSYIDVTGTSFAAAYVSGAMALLLSACPDNSVSALEAAMKDSARDLGAPGPDNEYGHGLIDIMAAYNLLTSGTVTSTSTTTSTVSTSSVTTTTTIQGLPCLIEETYGTYSERAKALRFVRDTVLSKTQSGQEIIRLYYQWSPVVVKAMKQDDEFKKEIKDLIDELLLLIGEKWLRDAALTSD